MYFSNALYPRLRSIFLLTASLAILLGAIKDTAGSFEFLFKTNLKVRLVQFKNFPCLKISSTVLVLVLERTRKPCALALFLFFGLYVNDIKLSYHIIHSLST